MRRCRVGLLIAWICLLPMVPAPLLAAYCCGYISASLKCAATERLPSLRLLYTASGVQVASL